MSEFIFYGITPSSIADTNIIVSTRDSVLIEEDDTFILDGKEVDLYDAVRSLIISSKNKLSVYDEYILNCNSVNHDITIYACFNIKGRLVAYCYGINVHEVEYLTDMNYITYSVLDSRKIRIKLLELFKNILEVKELYTPLSLLIENDYYKSEIVTHTIKYDFMMKGLKQEGMRPCVKYIM